MKQNWQIKKLGEVCEVIAGQSPEGKYYNQNGEGTPFYQGKKDFGEKYLSEPTVWTTNETKIAIENDILMSVRAPVGDINICNKRICIGRGLAAIRASNKLDNDFLFYYLLSEKPNIKGKEGAVFPTINKNEIAALEIPLPPLADQRRIVAILDDKFAKIDVLKAAAQKNLDNAEQLWKAQLEKEFGNKEWKMMKLGDVCEITSKLVNPTEPQYLNLYHVGGANIEAETGVIIDLKTSKEEGLSSGKFTFDNTMVLYNKIRPYLKKVARPTFSGLCSADMYPLYPNKNITKDFLFYVLMSDSFTDYAIKHSGRAGMPKVNRETLFAYNVAIPSLAEQTAIVSRLDALSAKNSELKAKYRRQIECCDELRQSLLRAAFEGEM